MKKSMDVYAQDLTRLQKDQGFYRWMTYPGSFMQRLREYGVNDARIKVLKECWRLPDSDERQDLGLPFRKFAWIREVSIYSGERIWMYARTVIPQETLTGKEQQLQHLKSRALGSILFRNPDMQRSEFEFFCLQPEMPWHKRISHYLSASEELWARRSVFSLQEKSLLLTEVFFPSIATL